MANLYDEQKRQNGEGSVLMDEMQKHGRTENETEYIKR